MLDLAQADPGHHFLTAEAVEQQSHPPPSSPAGILIFFKCNTNRSTNGGKSNDVNSISKVLC